MENINRFRFDDKPSCKLLLLHFESKVQHNNNKLEISALHCPVAIIWLETGMVMVTMLSSAP